MGRIPFEISRSLSGNRSRGSSKASVSVFVHVYVYVSVSAFVLSGCRQFPPSPSPPSSGPTMIAPFHPCLHKCLERRLPWSPAELTTPPCASPFLPVSLISSACIYLSSTHAYVSSLTRLAPC